LAFWSKGGFDLRLELICLVERCLGFVVSSELDVHSLVVISFMGWFILELTVKVDYVLVVVVEL